MSRIIIRANTYLSRAICPIVGDFNEMGRGGGRRAVNGRRPKRARAADLLVRITSRRGFALPCVGYSSRAGAPFADRLGLLPIHRPLSLSRCPRGRGESESPARDAIALKCKERVTS